MTRRALWQTAAILGLGALLGFAAGQDRPPPAPPPGPGAATRDNFGPQDGRLPRLSREALEKATKEGRDEAGGPEEGAKPEPRPPAAKPAVPLHRLSRDVMLQPATTATSHTGAADWQITLRNSFIETYKNRVTLTAPYRVIAYRKHTPADDGDAHVAGLADGVGLACVAEVMNVKFFNGALTLVKKRAEDGELLPVTGAWRLWCEHPDAVPETAGPQIQDDVITDFQTSNPNHVFEIHPVSRLGNIPLEDSFQPIEGYTPKEAKKAFQYYESLTCRIVPDPAHQTTTLFTPKAGYNYAEFLLEFEEDQQFITTDGRITRGTALSLDGTIVAEHRRMLFVKDTAPEQAARTKKKGDRMHVLGIPRIDLALVSYRTRVADTQPAVLGWHLPYEMIIVAMYEG